MRQVWCLCCVAIVIVRGLECQTPADDVLSKLRYPLSKGVALRAPNFELDLSEVADDEQAQAWGAEAQVLCEEWFPVLCRFLATEKWTPPATVRLVLKQELAAPGVTSGHTISFSVKWITAHPDDFGMVIHELCHIVQAYPNTTTERKPGWLVEGIADYIRYWKYEPEIPHPRIDAKRASYRQGYGTTAAFLAWLVRKYDRRIVLRLDAALRSGMYQPELFREWTGNSLDDLWIEFAEQLPQ